MHYVLHYDICAFVLSAFSLFCIYIKKGTRSKQNKIFLAIIISNLFAAVADISSAVADMSPESYGLIYLYFINSLYMVVHLLVPPLICFYIYYMLGFRHKHRSRVPWYIGVPYILGVLLIVTSPLTKMVFYFDDDKEYTRGALMPFLYVMIAAYMIMAVMKMIKYGKATSPGKLAMLVTYIFVGVFGVVVQFIFPELLLELFVEALACLGVLFSIENYDEMLNPNTHVLNRNALMKDVRKYMTSKTDFTLIVIRLKESSYITSIFGIESMLEIERNMISFFRSFDSTVVYHYSGGSYAMLCFEDEQTASSIVDSVIERFGQEWVVNGAAVKFGARISSARSPEEIDSTDMVAVMLDSPIETSIAGTHSVDVVPYKVYARRIEVDRALKRAMANKSFEVYYQPIFDLKDHKIHAAEALLRLHDEQLGDISPEEFVPIAEKHGYIIDIGKFVAEQVFKFYKERELIKLGIDFIDINLSAVQCMSDDFATSFRKIAQDSGVDMCHVTLEITESSLVHNRDVMKRMISDFANDGVRFSLDDFGTGYSNYSYILDYPFNIIKIDKSLLWSADMAVNGNRMFEGMMNMFRSMNIKTLVEGVENDNQRVLAEKNGCSYIQGFYFSEPVRADRFIEYVKDFNS